MQTLKPGEKSLVFNINGREHVVVVKVYNSTVADAPVKAAVKPATDPATEPVQNHGTVIAIAAGAAVVVVAVVVTAVAVKKKRKA